MSDTRNAWVLALMTATSALPAAASTLSWVDSVGTPNATTVAAGSSFTVTLRMNATESFIGTSVYAFDPGYTGTARYTLVSRTRVTDAFADAEATTANVAGDVFDAKTADYGYGRNDLAAQPAGTYDLMTLTIGTPSTLANGEYTLQLMGGVSGSILTDGSFGDVQFTNLSPADPATARYNVTVGTPEPAGGAAVALAATGLLARRRRRESL